MDQSGGNNQLSVFNSPTGTAPPVVDDGMNDDNSKITRNDFPSTFIFGVGTSAYQHEGAAAKGGKGPSVWDDFTLKTPDKIADGSNGNVAIDMYDRFKEDIKTMKRMGFEAYRFSIAWPRILPGGRCCAGINREGIDYYNKVIDTLLENGIQPYVTLFHWDLPYCLQEEYGGFICKNKIVKDFLEYVELCFWEFGDRVKHWVTLNEPWTYSVQGYAGCVFPPGANEGLSTAYLAALNPSEDDDFNAQNLTPRDFDSAPTPPFLRSRSRSRSGPIYRESSATNLVRYRGVHEPGQLVSMDQSRANNNNNYSYSESRPINHAKDVYTVARNLLLAHSAAVHSYRTKFQEQQEGKIGITLVSHWFEPYSDDGDDKKAAKRALDFMLGWFLEPIVKGHYPVNMIEYVPPENLAPFTEYESRMLKGSFDFLGLNYYTANYAANDPLIYKGEGYYYDQHVKYHTARHGIPIGPVAGSSWLFIVPWGIQMLLKYTNDTYKDLPPIYITENGVDEKSNCKHTACEACPDPIRIKYYQDHLAFVRRAMLQDHVDVRGFFAWSWCDNFEWTEGYTVRFGIMYIDYVNHLRRYPKHSAIWFTKFLTRKKLRNPFPITRKRQIGDAEDIENEKRLKAMEE